MPARVYALWLEKNNLEASKLELIPACIHETNNGQHVDLAIIFKANEYYG